MDGQKRKKWTPIEEPDEAVLKVREKRKWQIALRRYVIEKNKCLQYAPYFGLDIENFRLWVQLQFTEGLDWSNFSQKWQLDHVVPVNYFDFGVERELQLCWSFINIRVNPVLHEGPRPDLLKAKQYFQSLFERTKLSVCEAMIAKIDAIHQSQYVAIDHLSSFLNERRAFIESVNDFSAYEFAQLNQGVHLEEVLAERALLRNFS
jgi:hypothetical protein